MPGTVDISGITFSVYGSEAEANTYFLGSVNRSGWSDADGTERKRAMVSAARMLNREDWEGSETSPPQPLSWPRTGATDREGVAVDENTIPVDIEEASYELALALLNDPTIEDSVNTDNNLKRAKAGSAEVEFFKPVPGTRFPQKTQELITPYLGSEGVLIGMASGCDEESRFDDDKYNLSGGYA